MRHTILGKRQRKKIKKIKKIVCQGIGAPQMILSIGTMKLHQSKDFISPRRHMVDSGKTPVFTSLVYL